MRLEPSTLRALWPRAPQGLVDAVAAKSADVFARRGLTTRLRVLHFLAQISHESGGGTITRESLNYSTPERIAAVWPRRFTVESARPFLHNERALADAVYNGKKPDGSDRMGNRPGSDDGFNFRGRGLLQLTGRDSYREIGALVGLPLEDRPDLAFSPLYAIEIAAAEFQHLGCLPWCDKGEAGIEPVTKRVNGGYTGLASRKAWFTKCDAALPTADEPAPQVEPHTEDDPHPEPPALPRGSDEVLPPGVDNPDKTALGSKTIWSTLVTMVTSGALSLGNLVEPLKPILTNPVTLGMLLAAAIGAGALIIYERNSRMRADRV